MEEKKKIAWKPQSQKGRYALNFLLVVIILVIFLFFMPMLPEIRWLRVTFAITFDILYTFFSITGLVFAIKALKQRDRAVFLFVALVGHIFFCVVLVLFVAGEFLFPH